VLIPTLTSLYVKWGAKMPKQYVIELGNVDSPIEKPFVLKWARARHASPSGSTNVFSDTAALHAGVSPENMPDGETIGTTGYPQETADTTFSL
jgi:hypothetical protein